MREKHKIYSKHFNSDSIIGVKNPIPEHSKINRKSNAEGNTQTINDLVDDTEPPSKHNKSFANQKLSRQIRYISRNMHEPTNIDHSNKEGLYLKKIENYRVIEFTENILFKKTSPSEPNYIIIIGMDHDGNFLNIIDDDNIPNPYIPDKCIDKSALYEIDDSEERKEFRERCKLVNFFL